MVGYRWGDAKDVPKLDRYLLSQLMMLFGFFSLVLVSVYWVNRAVILFDQLIADGQSASVFLEFTALSLPNVIRLVLPVSAFIAAVYVTNRLQSESELVVARATGVSSFRLARAVIIFGLLIAVLMAVLVHVLVPTSRAQLADREVDVSNDVSGALLTEGQFVHPSAGITFYVREITPEGELLNIFLTDARQEDTTTTYHAQNGFLTRDDNGELRLVLFDGMLHALTKSTNSLAVTVFEDFSYDISQLNDEEKREIRDVREFDTWTLLRPTPEAVSATGAPRAQFIYEGHLRLTQPFSPMVAALLGFSALMVGSFSRFGVWRQIFLAVILLIVIQILENAAAGTARKDETMWWLVYVPPCVGIFMSLGLLTLAEYPALFRRRNRTGEVAS